MLSFGVAKELGMTVQQLHANITPEELTGLVLLFRHHQPASRRRR